MDAQCNDIDAEIRSVLVDPQDGENLALRCFLILYNGNVSITIAQMKKHMERSGWKGLYPSWVSTASPTEHLTKLGAANWIRYLLKLEDKSSTHE